VKILFWTDGFWPRIGGTETQGLQFVEAMQKKGHVCSVLAHKDQPNWKEDETYRGISIKRFDFNAILEKRELKNIRQMEEHLDSIVREFQPDIVYLNALWGGSAFVFLLFRSMLRMPIVATVHAPYYGEAIPPLVKQICSQIDRICCGSKWSFSVMERLIPSFKDKLRQIYCGISVPKILPSQLPLSPPIILALGRLVYEKGFDTAIVAFSHLKKRGSNAELMIAGSGPERSDLEKLVDRLGVGESVQFIGQVTIDEVPPLINRASFIVMPSYLEAFGLVALESMRMGRPVIATNVGGLPEIVTDRETGLLVPPRDPIALCKAMELLLGQPEELAKMGLRARKWAMGTYLLEENVTQYEAIFKELIGVPQ
jgi:glycogen(starch) synthase